MLMRNKAGDIFLWILSQVSDKNIRGNTMFPGFIILHSKTDLSSPAGAGIYLHEQTHQLQMLAYGWPKFAFKYIRDLVRHGYSRDLPLERLPYYIQECCEKWEGSKEV